MVVDYLSDLPLIYFITSLIHFHLAQSSFPAENCQLVLLCRAPCHLSHIYLHPPSADSGTKVLSPPIDQSSIVCVSLLWPSCFDLPSLLGGVEGWQHKQISLLPVYIDSVFGRQNSQSSSPAGRWYLPLRLLYHHAGDKQSCFQVHLSKTAALRDPGGIILRFFSNFCGHVLNFAIRCLLFQGHFKLEKILFQEA